jgi:hypothetical protein
VKNFHDSRTTQTSIERYDYSSKYPLNSRTDRYICEDRGNWGRRLADPREEEYRARGRRRRVYGGEGLDRRKGRGYSSLRLSREIRTTWGH